MPISIPAPARGATIQPGQQRNSIRNFNSRPCARGDSWRSTFRKWKKLFQFPPLREGRHCPAQDRSRVYAISIPAPARGATVVYRHIYSACKFQFPPLREGRRSADANVPITPIFQFPPLREGRHLCEQSKTCLIVFQFPPLREGRPCRVPFYYCNKRFQFPPLREGRHGPLLFRVFSRAKFQFPPLREGRRATNRY